jgi:chromosomal replication initiation ATPase DnaA
MNNNKITWIYGKCGSGKTTFANSIIEKEHGKICKMQGDELIQTIIKTLQSRSVNDLINYFKKFDLLVIDDLNFICLEGRPKTQIEIRWLIKRVIRNNKTRVILISQEEPSIFKKLFFNNCGYTELKTPTTEFKLKLVKKWAEIENVNLSDFLIKEIVEKTDNLFKLKGLFNQIAFSVKFNREKIGVQ